MISCASGAGTMLWYGYDDFQGKYRIAEKLQQLSAEMGGRRITSYDIWQESMTHGHARLNPGVPGCGLAAANLSEESIQRIDFHLKMMGLLYQRATFNQQPAALCTGLSVVMAQAR